MLRVTNHLLSLCYSLNPSFTLRFEDSDPVNIGSEIDPSLVVIHYTAGGPMPGTLNWIRNPESRVSYHLLIDRAGNLHQFAPFNLRAFHAGQSKFGDLYHLNGHSIGIGLCNWGRLQTAPDGYLTAWPQDYTHMVAPPAGATFAYHKAETQGPMDAAPPWESYPQVQLLSLALVLRALVDSYPISDIIGHDDCSLSGKVDPGPAFPTLPVSDLDFDTRVDLIAPRAQYPKPLSSCSSLATLSRFRCSSCPGVPCELTFHYAPSGGLIVPDGCVMSVPDNLSNWRPVK